MTFSGVAPAESISKQIAHSRSEVIFKEPTKLVTTWIEDDTKFCFPYYLTMWRPNWWILHTTSSNFRTPSQNSTLLSNIQTHGLSEDLVRQSPHLINQYGNKVVKLVYGFRVLLFVSGLV